MGLAHFAVAPFTGPSAGTYKAIGMMLCFSGAFMFAEEYWDAPRRDGEHGRE